MMLNLTKTLNKEIINVSQDSLLKNCSKSKNTSLSTLEKYLYNNPPQHFNWYETGHLNTLTSSYVELLSFPTKENINNFLEKCDHFEKTVKIHVLRKKQSTTSRPRIPRSHSINNNNDDELLKELKIKYNSSVINATLQSKIYTDQIFIDTQNILKHAVFKELLIYPLCQGLKHGFESEKACKNNFKLLYEIEKVQENLNNYDEERKLKFWGNGIYKSLYDNYLNESQSNLAISKAMYSYLNNEYKLTSYNFLVGVGNKSIEVKKIASFYGDFKKTDDYYNKSNKTFFIVRSKNKAEISLSNNKKEENISAKLCKNSIWENNFDGISKWLTNENENLASVIILNNKNKEFELTYSENDILVKDFNISATLFGESCYEKFTIIAGVDPKADEESRHTQYPKTSFRSILFETHQLCQLLPFSLNTNNFLSVLS